MSEIQPHQQRVIDEHEQLAERLVKLATFVASERYDQLDDAEQVRLSAQLGAMNAYLFILNERIAAF